MKQAFKFFIPLLCCIAIASRAEATYKNFVILIASYNNEQFAKHNIISALQNYPESHYRIIFIDDCSQDNTLAIAINILEQHQRQHLVTIFHNTERKGALYNHYYGIHNYIKDEEIVVILDGDDQLAHANVLTFLNDVYSKNDIWLTYGQFQHIVTGQVGFNCPMPHEVVGSNNFRRWRHIPSHLRTFYAKLYKNIRIEDLTLNGDFFEMCADMATMIPMIEQARDHFRFIPQILYLYNDNNPISDHFKSKTLQREIDLYVRSRQPYKPLEKLF